MTKRFIMNDFTVKANTASLYFIVALRSYRAIVGRFSR